MIWDKAARLAELLLKDLEQHGDPDHIKRGKAVYDAMSRAKLFVIEAAPHDFLPKDYTQEQCDFYNENFFLPFKTIAIEDNASLIILFDTGKHQRGLKTQRQWIEFLPWDVKREAFNDKAFKSDYHGAAKKMFPGTMLVTCGVIHEAVFNYGAKKSYIEGHIEGIALYETETGECLMTGAEASLKIPPEEMKHLQNCGIRNALSAIEEVAYFNNPDNFVLEETPASFERRRKRKKGKKAQRRISRYCDRPRYTVLKPKQIRRRMRLPEPGIPGGLKRRPHERRAHLRTYSNDEKKWPNMHGQTIVVKGSWIGPSESLINGKRYRVLIDMRPPQLPEKP